MIIGNPLVSIILTSYNNYMVEDTIRNVVNQTYKNWELLIMDDNSNQETLDIYKKFNDPRITIYNSHIKDKDRLTECPYARQINKGLKIAKGKLLLYLCDDIDYLPHKIETMVKFLRRHPLIKVCYNRQKIVFGKAVVEKAKRKFKGKRFTDYMKKKKTLDVRILAPDRVLRDPFCRVDHNSVMHYASCIKEVGDWETESFAMADAYFWRKLGKKFLFYPIKEVLELHNSHEESFSSKIVNKKVNVEYK